MNMIPEIYVVFLNARSVLKYLSTTLFYTKVQKSTTRPSTVQTPIWLEVHGVALKPGVKHIYL